MDSPSADLISSCRHCRYYTPEGRRGGHCGQLDALVHGDWKACPFAVSAFPAHWNLSTSTPPPLNPSTDLVPANTVPVTAAQSSAPKNSDQKGKNLDKGIDKTFKQGSFSPKKFKHHQNLEIATSGKPQPVISKG
ncbi:MAG: hypothetical protein AAGA67_09515 [Cyanobacteria bacterium P01_F01_bin.153]